MASNALYLPSWSPQLSWWQLCCAGLPELLLLPLGEGLVLLRNSVVARMAGASVKELPNHREIAIAGCGALAAGGRTKKKVRNTNQLKVL